MRWVRQGSLLRSFRSPPEKDSLVTFCVRIYFSQHCRAEWLLADEPMMREATGKLRGELLEPLKTVVVHGARAMAVWCLRKP
jgi:hypothetical protein